MSNERNIELEKRIDAYINGQLSDDEATQLWADLLEHPKYYAHLKTELALKRHFQPGKSTSPDTDNSSSAETPITTLSNSSNGQSNTAATIESSSVTEGAHWKWTMAAAAVIIIILGLNFFLPDQTQTARQMALADIEVGQMETPDVLRSGGSPQDSQVASLLGVGLNAALSGDQTTAQQQFNRALKQLDEPLSTMDSLSMASAHLNLGIIYYNQEQYEKAQLSFDQAVSYAQPSKRILEKSYWYLGNTLLNREQMEHAREAIHQTYALNGIYREPSYRLLRKLDYELGYVDYDDYEQQSEELGQ